MSGAPTFAMNFPSSIHSLKKAWGRYEEISSASESKVGTISIPGDTLKKIAERIKNIEDIKKEIGEIYNQTKILLINPFNEFKAPVLPLGLASIAGYLKNKNKDIEISVIDAWAENLNFQKLKDRVCQSGADIIGVTVVSPRYDKAKKTIEICREALPNSLIVAGGPHISALPTETLNDIPQLDICVIGEGELTTPDLLKNLDNLGKVDGIAFRKEGKITRTKPKRYSLKYGHRWK